MVTDQGNGRDGCCLAGRRRFARALSALMWLLWAGLGAAPAWAGFWVCPGNLLTNQLGPQEAQALRCTPLEPGGLSQAHGPVVDDAPLEAQASPTAVTPAAPAAAGQPGPAPVPKPRPAAQQQRDDDARQILQAELARTQAQIQALGLRPSDPQTTAAAHRLRSDEAALQRELARLGR